MKKTKLLLAFYSVLVIANTNAMNKQSTEHNINSSRQYSVDLSRYDTAIKIFDDKSGISKDLTITSRQGTTYYSGDDQIVDLGFILDLKLIRNAIVIYSKNALSSGVVLKLLEKNGYRKEFLKDFFGVNSEDRPFVGVGYAKGCAQIFKLVD